MEPVTHTDICIYLNSVSVYYLNEKRDEENPVVSGSQRLAGLNPASRGWGAPAS